MASTTSDAEDREIGIIQQENVLGVSEDGVAPFKNTIPLETDATAEYEESDRSPNLSWSNSWD